MNWSSWDAFLAMGGYAPYVWGSVGVVFALMAIELLALRRQRHAVLAGLRQAQRLPRRRASCPTAVPGSDAS